MLDLGECNHWLKNSNKKALLFRGAFFLVLNGDRNDEQACVK